MRRNKGVQKETLRYFVYGDAFRQFAFDAEKSKRARGVRVAANRRLRNFAKEKLQSGGYMRQIVSRRNNEKFDVDALGG